MWGYAGGLVFSFLVYFAVFLVGGLKLGIALVREEWCDLVEGLCGVTWLRDGVWLGRWRVP